MTKPSIFSALWHMALYSEHVMMTMPKGCPCCRDRQVQLLYYQDGKAFCKCRICSHHFTGRIPKYDGETKRRATRSLHDAYPPKVVRRKVAKDTRK